MAFPQPISSVPMTDPDFRPSLVWRQYLPVLDAVIRGLVGTSNFKAPVSLVAVAVPTNANAATAGVAIGQLYCDTANPCKVYIRTAQGGGVWMIRTALRRS